jgi:hypothetical protein
MMYSEQEHLTAEDITLADDLHSLSRVVQAESRFVDRLENQLLVQKAASMKALQPRFRRLMTAAAAVLILLAATWTIPPLRAVAQEAIAWVFTQVASMRTFIEYQAWSPDDMQTFSTLVEADALENQLGFAVLIPTAMPDGFTFVQASTLDPNNYISLEYSHRTYILQSREAYSEEVGANARIITTSIQTASGLVNGQFVQGAWVFPTPPDGMPHPSQGIQGEAEWRSDVLMRRLRWSQDNIFYEITTNATDGSPRLLTLEELVQIAESLR